MDPMEITNATRREVVSRTARCSEPMEAPPLVLPLEEFTAVTHSPTSYTSLRQSFMEFKR